jgi:hypothetical protein
MQMKKEAIKNMLDFYVLLLFIRQFFLLSTSVLNIQKRIFPAKINFLFLFLFFTRRLYKSVEESSAGKLCRKALQESSVEIWL